MITVLDKQNEVDLGTVTKAGLFLVTKTNGLHGHPARKIVLARYSEMLTGYFFVVEYEGDYSLNGSKPGNLWKVSPNSGYFGVEVKIKDVTVEILK